MDLDLRSLFSPDGPLRKVDPRFEERPQQAEMAEAVWDALENGKGLVVEAGTGVGKSLSYLLPGALWAVSHGARLIVSTHTRALQEQLLERELPLVERVLRELGQPFRFAMLMGADNYLCVQRLQRAADSDASLSDIVEWSREAKTGHRSALPRLLPSGTWGKISRDPDLCQRLFEGCLYRKDRERAERSHVLVVNHALLLSGARLPSYEALVVDEAHTFEEVAASRFGLAVTTGRVARLCEEASEYGVSEAASAAAKALLDFLGSFKGPEPEGGRLLRKAESSVPRELDALEQALCQVKGDKELDAKTVALRCAELRAHAGTILADGSGEGWARWASWTASSVELRAEPLEVGERLAEGLLSRGMPVVMTSATLSTGRGLAPFKKSLGFEGARDLVLDSPYDYASQAALMLWEGLPEPSEDEEYVEAVASAVKSLMKEVPGGIFVLFSSWRVMRRVHALLRKVKLSRPLWIQGDAGHDALLSEFSAAGDAVLLGVDTFWQGVDVQGTALSCVVIVKLPFPNPSSPVEEARRAWYESLERSYFAHYSLPKAVMKLRQGFGRLIRSATDRGAVVILDPRVSSKRYGSSFLEALPKCRRLSSLEEVGGFFKVAS